MRKHTPGPWAIEIDNGGIRSAVNAGVKHIAMVNFYKSGNADTDVYGEEHAANCHLIAAAPELLESLGDVLSLALIKWGNLDPDANKVFAAARAAIAKATAKGK